MTMRLALFCGWVLALAACTRVSRIDSTPSPPPANGAAHLRAGFASVDITPPPGAGLFGYGTEGARSRGYRMRLQARALVLEDPAGERIAFVLADLGAVSALLHRKVAEVIIGATGIGADRLLLSATHTHSAPGHFFGAPAYDEQASVVEGFDPELTDALASGIARAVIQAFERRDHARAAWGRTAVWKQTRVRNNSAVERNPKRFLHPSAAGAALPDDPRYRYIDPQLSMLRVDVRDGASFRPAGSLIIFPVHGTLNSGANQLMDGDLHSIVMQQLERKIAPGAGGPDAQPRSVHLFANGAEGDIVADFSPASRCPAPAPRQDFVPTGPRRPVPRDLLLPVVRPVFPECLQLGRANAYEIGNAIAGLAAGLHERLAAAVQQPGADQLRIARMFDVLSASAQATPQVLCKPRTGPATIGGAEGGFSRLLNLAVFRTILGIDTLASAPAPLPAARACRGGKDNIDWFEDAVAGERPYPFEVQLSVVRIGDVTIGAVPGEATTNAGARMRRAMARDSNADFAAIYEKQLILGLTNGYVHYIATPYEYTAQLYEGAATLYGPYTAEIFAQQLRRLARLLPEGAAPSPTLEIKPVTMAARNPHRIVPTARATLPDIERTLNTCWRGDTLVARWNDHVPGDLNPAAGALLQIERQEAGRDQLLTWDDDPFLEVWHLSGRRRQAVWEARYAPREWQTGRYRVVLRARRELPAVSGAWIESGSPLCKP